MRPLFKSKKASIALVGLVAGLCFNMTSCGDDNDNGSTEEIIEKTPVMLLGDEPSNENIATAMNKYFELAKSPESHHKAIFISGEQIEGIIADPKNQPIIQLFIDNKKPVVLVSPNASQTQQLTDYMALNANSTDQVYANWRSFQADDSNELHWTIHSTQFNHPGSGVASANEKDINEDTRRAAAITDSSQQALREHILSPLPSELESKVSLNASALKSLANKGELDAEQQEVLFSTTGQDEITDVETADFKQYVVDVYYDEGDDVVSVCFESESNGDCEDATDEYPYARYSFSMYVYTFNEGTTETDYHYVKLAGNFAQANVYTEDSGSERGWYAIRYGLYGVLASYGDNGINACSDIWTTPDEADDILGICEDVDCDSDDHPILTQSGGLSLLESSPQTQTDCTVTTYESSVDYSVSGDISTDSLGSVGMSISESKSYTSVDVCQINDSGVNSMNPAIFFDEITSPNISEGAFCYDSVDEPSGSATDTFTPVKMWIWSTDKSVRDGTDGNQLILCAGMSYAWEKKVLSGYDSGFLSDCGVDDNGYTRWDAYTRWGWASGHNTFELVDVSETSEE